ncbi:MAG: hypothetical protein OEN50_11010 [Deltaproteobacteria bacterium]|nr:hypothetical protein [Deltaproteobacteria bacterium]
MYEFLLAAVVIVYLLITYVPISEAPKARLQNRRDDGFPVATPKPMAAQSPDSVRRN